MVSLKPPKQYMAVDIETTSLNPEAGIITAIGFGTPGGVVEVKVNNEDSDEADLLEWLERKISESDSNTIVAWNAPFDLRFIRSRCLILEEENPTTGTEMFDLMAWFKAFAKFKELSLDYVAKELGMGSKVGKRHKMPSLFWKGEYEEITRHCARDIELLIGIHERCLQCENGQKRDISLENPYLEDEEDVPTFG